MSTTRPFAYNSGSTIDGTTQFCNIAIGVSAQDYSADPGGVKWWMGPDEDLGYILAFPVPNHDHPAPGPDNAGIGFKRSKELTDESLLSLINVLKVNRGLLGDFYVCGGLTWLNDSGVWSNYYVPIVKIISTGIYTEYPTFISVNEYNKVWGWGLNYFGQLGNNSNYFVEVIPVSVLGIAKTFCQLSTGYHSMGLDNHGKVWCWGNNGIGQLGVNSITNYSTPVAICGTAKTFCQITAVRNNSLGIDNHGKVWGWGYNTFGQLGNNSVVSYSTPVSICGTAKTFCQIFGGYNHSLGLDNHGKVWCWGYNGNGELGNNSVTSYSTPVAICGAAKTFCQISGSGGNSLGLDNHGKVWGWGYNYMGQLGNNSITLYSTPVSICGTAKTFCQISGGYLHSLGIDNHGKVWCWGFNNGVDETNGGQLGNNSITPYSTPVSICGTAKTFCKLCGGFTYSIGIDNHGKVWGWGNSAFGFGNLDWTPIAYTPIRVSNI